MPPDAKKAYTLAIAYLSVVLAGLFYVPWLKAYVAKQEGVSGVLFGSYLLAGLVLFFLFYVRFQVRSPVAYGMLIGLVLLFFAAFSRVGEFMDRLHFLEHGLGYVFIYRALWFRNRGLVLVGRSFILSLCLAALDEGLQSFFPGREASWGDFWTDVFSYYLAAGLVAIAHKYRRA